MNRVQLFSDSWTEKPAFGTALDEHLKRSGREIALPVEACVMMLLETGMKEEVRPGDIRPPNKHIECRRIDLCALNLCHYGVKMAFVRHSKHCVCLCVIMCSWEFMVSASCRLCVVVCVCVSL